VKCIPTARPTICGFNYLHWVAPPYCLCCI